MKYLSVCSGIEAATVAWHPLGWQPMAFSEIEPFPSAVLAHHYPAVPNVGDMTKHKEWNLDPIDLFVGGTPCQSFSVAGLRKGLDDPRGNLMLTYLAIADQRRPRWLVWENVPGVLSSNAGKDFGTFLGGLAELGYGFAYRVLDAQYFGVAQRRRRVFVVGYLGDWRPAAAVLFERDSLCGNPAPSREARKDITECAGTLTANGGGLNRPAGNANELDFCITVEKTYDSKQHHNPQPSDTAQLTTLNCAFVRGDTPLVQAIPIDSMNHIGRGDRHSFGDFVPGAPSYTLTKGHSHAVAYQSAGGESRGTNQQRFLMQPVAFAQNQLGEVRTGDVFNTLNTNSNASGRNMPMVVHGTQDPCVGEVAFAQGRNNGGENVLIQPTIQTIGMAVRRLTPIECERLQGFPDNYTAIPWRKGTATNCPDGPRYKALGNSMAVPVMRWIGERIQQVEEVLHDSARSKQAA